MNDIPETTTPTRDRSKPFPKSARVVIIGGGIVGCSVAYHLTELGWTDVVLLERHQLTGGTTWHAAGLVGTLRATHNMTSLAKYSGDLYSRLEAEMGFPTGFKRTGSIAVADNAERLEELTRSVDMAHCFDVEANVVSVEELAAYWPLMNADDIIGGVHVPADGQTSPVDTTMALAKAAKQGGARIIEDVRVQRILTRDRKAVGVETTRGNIDAEFVVNCAGMWGRRLASDVGVAVPLNGCEHFYIVTEPVEGLTPGLPTLRDPGNCIYIKEDAGRLLVGAFEPVAKPIDERDLPDKPFLHLDEDWEHLAPVIDAAIHRMPVLGEVGIRLFFNGPESFTPDDRYLLGPTPELDNHFVAVGFNSVGIQSAGGAGLVLAQWMTEGRPPMDLWDVDVRRVRPFQANERYVFDRSRETLGLLYQMHWPYRQVESARGVRRSAIHDKLVDAGACMGEMIGWERPNWYAREGAKPEYEYSYGRQNWFDFTAAECRAVRNEVGLFDQSSFSKFMVQGPDSMRVLNQICGNDMDVEPGRTIYTQWLNEQGGIESDLTITRFDEDAYMVVTAVGSQTRDFDWLRRHITDDDRVIITDVTSGWTMLGLMGPNSRPLLQSLTTTDMSNEAWAFGDHREIELGYARVRAQRLTYVGELGWEIFMPTEFAGYVYEQIMEAGSAYGLVLAGYHAMDSLRLEKGYRHFGHDITDADSPLQAGLSFAVAWDKPGGFIGREALLAQRDRGLDRRLVQFKLNDPEPLTYHDHPILRNGERVGFTSSGNYGHCVGGAVSMGYVNHETGFDRAELLNAEFELVVNGSRVSATASYRPLYEPTNPHTKA